MKAVIAGLKGVKTSLGPIESLTELRLIPQIENETRPQESLVLLLHTHN